MRELGVDGKREKRNLRLFVWSMIVNEPRQGNGSVFRNDGDKRKPEQLYTRKKKKESKKKNNAGRE